MSVNNVVIHHSTVLVGCIFLEWMADASATSWPDAADIFAVMLKLRARNSQKNFICAFKNLVSYKLNITYNSSDVSVLCCVC